MVRTLEEKQREEATALPAWIRMPPLGDLRELGAECDFT
jgi:hypothetical protein